MQHMRCIFNLSAVTILFIAGYYVLDSPFKKRYDRYLSYVSMDDLLEYESQNVSRVLHCGTNGIARTIVIMDFCSINPSGPSVFVFDQHGVRIDATHDLGSDFRFNKAWRPVMKDAELARVRNKSVGQKD